MKQDLAPGTLFAEKYRILDRIGRGGMGTVYAAQHMGLERKLAIKVLHRRSDEADAFLKRFIREARVASSVEHQNIVDVTDAGITADWTAYYVMEHLQGEDLATMFRREGPLPWPRACHIVIQICDALQAAHDKGIIHRDIKPANCFRITRGTNDDFIKVLDFGIAKIKQGDLDRTSDTSVGDFLGTARYMPPEQAQSPGTVDHRVDVYAVGVVLYEALTGTTPFTGSNPGQVLHNLFLKDPTPVRELNPAVPEAVEAVTMKALRRDPDTRHQSTRAFSRALEKLRIAHIQEVGAGSVRLGGDEASPISEASTLRITPPREGSRTAALTSASRRARYLWPVVALTSAALLSVTAYALSHDRAVAPPVTAPAYVDDPPSVAPTGPIVIAAATAPGEGTPAATYQPLVVDDLAEEPGEAETPLANKHTATKRSKKLDCEPVWKAAKAREDESAWTALLLVVNDSETRACWSRGPRALERRKYRVRAYMESKNFEACVKEGTGFNDSKVQNWVSLCARRYEGSVTEDRAKAAAARSLPPEVPAKESVEGRAVDAPLEVEGGAG